MFGRLVKVDGEYRSNLFIDVLNFCDLHEVVPVGHFCLYFCVIKNGMATIQEVQYILNETCCNAEFENDFYHQREKV